MKTRFAGILISLSALLTPAAELRAEPIAEMPSRAHRYFHELELARRADQAGERDEALHHYRQSLWLMEGVASKGRLNMESVMSAYIPFLLRHYGSAGLLEYVRSLAPVLVEAEKAARDGRKLTTMEPGVQEDRKYYSIAGFLRASDAYEAAEILDAALDNLPPDPDLLVSLNTGRVDGLIRLGKLAEARRILSKAPEEAMKAAEENEPLTLASIWVGLGEDGKARALLDAQRLPRFDGTRVARAPAGETTAPRATATSRDAPEWRGQDRPLDILHRHLLWRSEQEDPAFNASLFAPICQYFGKASARSDIAEESKKDAETYQLRCYLLKGTPTIEEKGAEATIHFTMEIGLQPKQGPVVQRQRPMAMQLKKVPPTWQITALNEDSESPAKQTLVAAPKPLLAAAVSPATKSTPAAATPPPASPAPKPATPAAKAPTPPKTAAVTATPSAASPVPKAPVATAAPKPRPAAVSSQPSVAYATPARPPAARPPSAPVLPAREATLATQRAALMTGAYVEKGFTLTRVYDGTSMARTPALLHVPVEAGVDYLLVSAGDVGCTDVDLFTEDAAGHPLKCDNRVMDNGLAGIVWSSSARETLHAVIYFPIAWNECNWIAQLWTRRKAPR